MELDRIALMDDWRFALTDDEDAMAPSYPDDGFRHVDLPHDWQIEQPRTPDAPGGGSQGFFPRDHKGVYRKRFHAPADWQDREVRVLFDGVQHFSDVYLNGVRVGGRPYGYVPFTCDLSQALRYGEENLLAVTVDNRGSASNLSVAVNDGGGDAADLAAARRVFTGDRWYSGAGIYRNVWLLVDHPTHLVHDGICVHAVPDGEGAAVSIAAEVARPQGAEVSVVITDQAGAPVARAMAPAAEETEISIALAKAALWSVDAPNLYTAEVTLAVGGEVIDAQSVTFGVRTAVFDGDRGFLLNGVPVKLYGVNLHHDGVAVGAAVPIEVWARRLAALKPLGINTIRASHNPQAEEFYGLCDRMGFLVIDELYDKWSESGMYFDRFFDEWHLRDLEAMIRRDRNHPSVVVWSVGNEIWHQFSELFYDCLKRLCDHTRRLDPTRPVSAALIGFVLPEYNDRTPLETKVNAVLRYAEIVDVFMGNYMEHFYETFRAAGMRIPVLGTEVRMYYRLGALDSVNISPLSPIETVKRHDWVCGALIWAGVDYLGESAGWPCRGWTGNPLDSTADWKLRAWHLAAQFQEAPVLKLAVYDEEEPWDMARGLWGFPQLRAHWRYDTPEKMKHVVAMTNCDEVRFIQNEQTPRVQRLCDHPDGMIHVDIPFAPGQLRAEGYRNGVKVCEDILRSDYAAETLRVVCDREMLPADGRSVAHVDIYLEDAYDARYVLENPAVTYALRGDATVIAMDNGDPMRVTPFDAPSCPMFSGHMLLLVKAGRTPGPIELTLSVEGFAPATLKITAK